MRTLITGFGAFPGVPINPTELLMRRWQDRPERRPCTECQCRVLPTEYETAERIVQGLLTGYAPRLVILTGVKGSDSTISLERFALNIDDSTSPDAGGDVREGRPIRPGAPVALMTPVDLPALRNALVARDFGVDISNHAGTYVCNHVYYCALTAVASLAGETDVLFVHVPMHLLAPRRDVIEAGYIDYLESALAHVWQHLERRLNGAR